MTIAGSIDITGGADGLGPSGNGAYLSASEDLPECGAGIQNEISKIKDLAGFLKFVQTHLTDGSIAPLRSVSKSIVLTGQILGHKNYQANCHPLPVLFIESDQISITGKIELDGGIVFVSGSIDSDSQERIDVGEGGILMIIPGT